LNSEPYEKCKKPIFGLVFLFRNIVNLEASVISAATVFIETLAETTQGSQSRKITILCRVFELLHNLRKRGKKALQETFELLLKPDLRNYQQC
jgi:hypothetical protein